MTETEQQIALCEWMGWTKIISVETWHKQNPDFASDFFKGFYVGIAPNGSKNRFLSIPDTSSLDVLHEMEKRLNKNQQLAYIANLWEIKKGKLEIPEVQEVWWALTTATAAQRAEAFLKTLNLWKQ